MVTKVEKEAIEGVTDELKKTLTAAREGVKSQNANTGDAKLDKILDSLVDEFAEITVKLRRKNDKNQWETFASLTGVSPLDLQLKGLDGICMEEGGAGEYEVSITTPTGVTRKLGVTRVGGMPARPISKSVEAQMGPMGMYGMGMPGMPGFGLPWAHGTVPPTGCTLAPRPSYECFRVITRHSTVCGVFASQSVSWENAYDKRRQQGRQHPDSTFDD